jgi:hypothetical protein
MFDSYQRCRANLVFALLCVLAMGATLGAEEPAADRISAEDLEFFEKDVRPLLVKRCFECHDGKTTKQGLSLAPANGWQQGGDSGPVIEPGTDEIRMNAADKPVHVRDFHASILHRMGLDHERLTYRHAGLDFRLTRVEQAQEGKVILT